MKRTLKIYGKIIGLTVLRFLLIILSGWLFSFIWAMIVLFQSFDYVQGGGHAGGAVGLIQIASGLLHHNIPGFILLFGAALFMAFYVVYANKTAIQYGVYQVWKQKAEGFLMPKVTSLTAKVIEKKPTLSWITNQSVLKLKLLSEARKDPETSGVKRRLISYLFKKANFDKIDFTMERDELPAAVSTQIAEFIAGTARPLMRLFWTVMGVQTLLFILSQC